LNEVWGTAIYLNRNGIQVELIQHFSKISLQDIKHRDATAWNAPDAVIARHTRGTAL